MSKQRSNIVAVLDIGTFKIACFIAEVGRNGKIKVLGIGQQESQGYRAGTVTNVKALERAIALTVESAEKMAEESIQSVYVNIASNLAISSMTVSNELVVTGHDISPRDEKKILFQVLDRYVDQGLEVIHSFVHNYILDNQSGIFSPLGMFGNKLACEYHIVAVHPNHIINLVNAISQCQLKIQHSVVSSYASGISCITPDEGNLGVTVLEIGGGITSVAVYHKGHLIFSDGVPLGGMQITNDIAQGLCTDLATAERIKNLYGAINLGLNDSKEKIEVPISQYDSESHIVSRALLIEIVSARIEEILEIVRDKLISSYAYKYSGNKIVITGGGAQLNGIKDLVSKIFNKTARIGYPTSILGVAESTSGLAFAGAIGLLLYAAEVENMHFTGNNKEGGIFRSIANWFKENFVA